MFRIVIAIFLSGLIAMSCQKGKRVTPPQKAPDEITEFQPTVQGKDYINEEGPRSFVPEDESSKEEVRKIKDGTYVADVEYFNISTGGNVTCIFFLLFFLHFLIQPELLWLLRGKNANW